MFEKVKEGKDVHKRLLLIVPTYGPVDPILQKNLRVAMMVASKHGVEWAGDASPDRMGFSSARNAAAQAILDNPCDGALWVDSDISMEPQHIWKLLIDAEAFNAEFICGIYHQRKKPHHPTIYQFNPENKMFSPYFDWADNIVAPIDACGFGFVYTSRKLIQDIAKLPTFNERAGWFPDTRDLSGGYGEDMNFALQAKEAGVQAYADSGIMLGHQGDARIVVHEDFLLHMKEDDEKKKKESAA